MKKMLKEGTGPEKPAAIQEKIILFSIFLIALFSRLYRLGHVPEGVWVDGAYGAYEAYSLIKTGMDSHGYAFPVYLVTWGSGMSALNTYLLCPLIAVFGLTTTVIRIPEVTVALLSVPSLYFLIKWYSDRESEGLLYAFLLAVCPWHIILSRWSIDNNLAPGFLLFSILFFEKGIRHSKKWFLLSGVLFGLTLYTYALVWLIVPAVVFFLIIYAYYCKRLSSLRDIVPFCVILFLFALPLMLFLAVNNGLLEEIRLPFLSIPRLVVNRSMELNLDENKMKLLHVLRSLLIQDDNQLWDVSKFGTIYMLSTPFCILGLFSCIYKFIKSLIDRQYFGYSVFLVIFFMNIVIGSLKIVDFGQINTIFIPLVVFTGYGIACLYRWAQKLSRPKKLGEFCLAGLIAAYLVLFIAFERHYFTDYTKEIEETFFHPEVEEPLRFACEKFPDQVICFAHPIKWVQILFYVKVPPESFQTTVKWGNYPAAWLYPDSFDRFISIADLDDVDPENVYIVPRYSEYDEFLMTKDFTAEVFSDYVVYSKNSYPAASDSEIR